MPGGLPRVVKRDCIFKCLMQEYDASDILHEYPVCFRYEGELGVDTGGVTRDVFATFWEKADVCFRYEGELGVDTGGVTRDVFATFWEKAYEQMFGGVGSVVPLVMPQTDFSRLGIILSHGYLVSGWVSSHSHCIPNFGFHVARSWSSDSR